MADEHSAVEFEDDEECWMRLEDHRMILIKTIEPSRIIPYLRQCRVLNSEDEEQIYNDPNLVIRRRKVGVLLDILQRTGHKGYVAFLESLELDYPQLYQKITGKEPSRVFSILVDTAGESGLTQFLMNELTRLQKELQNERQARLAASAHVAEQSDTIRRLQTRECELRKQQERVQRMREERDQMWEKARHLKDENYKLMSDMNRLSEEKNCALMCNRDLQLEVQISTNDDTSLIEDFQKQSQAHQELVKKLHVLRRELHDAEELRDKYLEKNDELELKCEILKKDSKMYCNRMEDILKQLDEVIKERDKAISSREEFHQENCKNLQDKDHYRKQLREMGERYDELQVHLFRTQGELLALQAKFRRQKHLHKTLEELKSQTSEEDFRERYEKGVSDDSQSPTSGEYNVCITITDPCASDAKSLVKSESNSSPLIIMDATRVVPSGKVYRQMFDAQAHLSLSLHEGRKKRLNEDNTISRNTDQSGAEQCSEDMMRNQLFSGMKTVFSVDQDDHDEIRGLPDNVVPAKTGSDIIERLTEKKQREHMEIVTQLQRELTELSVRYESLLRDTGEDFLLRLSEYDEEVESLMQKTEQDGNLPAFSYQGLQEFWTSVSRTFAMRRNCIQELDELFVKYEIQRAAEITAILKNYTIILEKINYVMPSDVHRLINHEAMLINQALLANRQALAKLHLNLMEKNLQKEVLYHLKWETKFHDWKKIKLVAAISQFEEFLNSPRIQNPENVQDTLNTMRTKQKAYSEQRLQILEQVRNITPPNCSKSSAAEWYSSLSEVNEQIDRMHNETMTKLSDFYENTWQGCSEEIDLFKNKVSTYGFSSEEIKDIVKREIVPLIGKCRTQREERLAAMKTAFKGLAQTAAFLSKSLFEFVEGVVDVWEVHGASLQRTEQQLQDSLEEIGKSYEEKNQKKEAQLDVFMDKLRQESTEKALKAALEQTLNYLEEIKEGCVYFYKEGVKIVESYPVIVMKEVCAYSIAVSRYFNVNEIYSQDPEELQTLYPSLVLGESQILCIKKSSPSVNLSPSTFQDVTSQAHTPDSAHTEDKRNFQNTETFTTLKGNVYSCPVIRCDDAEERWDVLDVEAALYPSLIISKSLIVELQRNVRENFFNHLETRYQEALNYTTAFMEAKKDKLKSELDLRLHLHQPRAKRIEMDIHNVRAAELILHQDRVDRHCKGILQALTDFRTEYDSLQVVQRKINEDFRVKIHSMEDTLYTATKSDTLVKLSTSLQLSLSKHINDFKELQRNVRQNMEIKFEGLREANAHLMKNFKLFAEGGNFTPKEISQYKKHLEKMAKRIDSADDALMQDMEGTESKCLEKAKEIINKFEERLQFLKVDLMFLEKIQSVLTNTQVQIKSEVMNSNTYKKLINSVMAELKDTLHGYTKNSPDNRDPSMAVPLPDSPLQGAFAVASRPRSRKQEKVESPTADALLQPSCMGTAFVDDKAVEVIKGLLRISKPQSGQEVSEERKETPTGTGPVHPSNLPRSGKKSGRSRNRSALGSVHRRSAGSASSRGVRRLTKPTRFDERFQVFGPKPNVPKEILTFKGLITRILWEANDSLLQVAEDFYKKKDRRSISRPQFIQETFELCAEDLNKRLLVYQSQSHEYHRGCVQEFCKQLMAIEEIVCEIPKALLTKLSDQHFQELNESLSLIRKQFKQTQQQSEKKKKEHSSKLKARLNHPACEGELNRLVTAEEDRQTEQRKRIESNRLELQTCIQKNADELVTKLATLTESLLFQFDNILTVDEIQGGSEEPKRENIMTLVRQTKAGVLQEEHGKRSSSERGSRAWPGISYFRIPNGSSGEEQKRETATITTTKSTMAQLRVMEVRNLLHQQRITQEFRGVEKFRKEQEAELIHWQEHWKGQLKTLATLKSE
ncbi:Caspase recruitment domain-containing protein 9 [Bagarius yarrelli]|uniref:Caspase recruitment domain-containing protein 9 n=1 Tax=Bagarius yarrelli TaxID=175774 RepID=A0A556U5J6_BAGYA|nr:Caspase recruitment domain-containing protein 9 [Bagarius yarrelli]